MLDAVQPLVVCNGKKVWRVQQGLTWRWGKSEVWEETGTYWPCYLSVQAIFKSLDRWCHRSVDTCWYGYHSCIQKWVSIASLRSFFEKHILPELLTRNLQHPVTTVTTTTTGSGLVGMINFALWLRQLGARVTCTATVNNVKMNKEWLAVTMKGVNISSLIHFECLGLKRKPRVKYWYCPECKKYSCTFLYFRSLQLCISSCKHYACSPKLVSAAHTNTSLSTVATSVSPFLLINMIGSLECRMEYLFFKSPIMPHEYTHFLFVLYILLPSVIAVAFPL